MADDLRLAVDTERTPEAVAHTQLRHEAHHALERQPHHREVVAVDALHDRRAEPLDTVRARLVHWLARRDVGLDVLHRQRMKGHPDDLDRRALETAPSD